MKNEGILTVISGFSGAGKGTIVSRLLKDYDRYWVSVSMTTRPMRPGEVDGVSYHFVSRERFEELIEADGFLEYAEYEGNYYGTPKEEALRHMAAGEDVILEIEFVGAFKVKKALPDALMLFVVAPSASELKRRLVGRGTETKEKIEGRLRKAVKESEAMEGYDFVLVNDDLDVAVADCHHLIQLEKLRIRRNLDMVERLHDELLELTAEG